MTTTEQSADRPLIITVLCLVGVIGVGFALLRIVQQWEQLAQQPTLWLLAALGALVVSAVCIYGFWRMKRWALVLLAAALLARLAWSLVSDQPLILSRMLGPVALLAFGLIYMRRMD